MRRSCRRRGALTLTLALATWLLTGIAPREAAPFGSGTPLSEPVPAGAAASQPGKPPLLVILTETDVERDGLPVYRVHPDADATIADLSRGLSGTMLRVYRRLQIYRARRDGIEPEPAYVLLSGQQGGFARRGFFLEDEEKRSAGYVDVHRDWPVTGSFGALDQIVPHELAHVIRRQLVGPLEWGGSNQVHALGVRTDRVVAFNEGFAESLQALAIEHPDAHPATARLVGRTARYARARRHLDEYRDEMGALLAVAPRMRMGFLAWYPNDEDVLRYFGVVDNALARAPVIPQRLLTGPDPYRAYLLESVLLGDPAAEALPVARMAATEGVVSTLFYRWALDAGIRSTLREAAFYELFGTERDAVGPLENVYLKLFHVVATSRAETVFDVIDGYRDSFPDEADRVDAVVDATFLGQPAVAPPEIWLANPAFRTGTTIFDQYRGLPRLHTFDLNAASVVDLVSVEGVSLETARAIQGAAPYATVGDLAAVPGVGPELAGRFEELQAEMEALRRALDDGGDETLSIQAILMPTVWRLVAVLVLATIAGALGYRSVRRRDGGEPPSWLRTGFDGLGAALVASTVCWWLGSASFAVAAPVVLFGLPAAVWTLRKGGSAGRALTIMAAWALAAFPAVLLTNAW